MNTATERLKATIVVTDIRNFTKMVNILSLEETHAFLNDCFSLIVETVNNYGGTVDKFIGDAVIIVFGDPISAVRCALDIQRRVEEINITWRKAFDFLVEIDIGISTGEVLAGNVGHPEKMQYTVIGKNVNLAAQIARLCEQYNVNILLDQRTYDWAKDDFHFRNLGGKLILGFTEAIKLYTPIPPVA